jgi:hypothetical protein
MGKNYVQCAKEKSNKRVESDAKENAFLFAQGVQTRHFSKKDLFGPTTLSMHLVKFACIGDISGFHE